MELEFALLLPDLETSPVLQNGFLAVLALVGDDDLGVDEVGVWTV